MNAHRVPFLNKLIMSTFTVKGQEYDAHTGNGQVDSYGEQYQNLIPKQSIYNDSVRDWLNFVSGEASADNALARQEYFYKNFQSPEALVKQYKEAGLSPALMYGTKGASGSGTSGVSASPRSSAGNFGNLLGNIFGGVSQAAQLAIDITKTKAEIDNINSQTSLNNSESGLKDVQKQYQEYMNTQKNIENSLMNTYLYAKVGDPESGQSLYQIASNCKTYDNFMSTIMKEDWADDTKWYAYTETGQKVLRSIYKASHEFESNIAELESTKTNAIFTKGLLDALISEDFANLSAKEQVSVIKRNTENANLEADQSEAWNKMLDKLGDGSGKDTVIIIGMLLKTLLGQTSFSASTSASHIIK